MMLSMLRKVVFAEGEYYHLYSRGVEKRVIFLDDHDRERFIKLLYLSNSKIPFVFRDVENLPLNEINRGDVLVAIGAYVLMDNHFHILVKEVNSEGISRFMKKLLTAYSSYFNKRHGRSGVLFQGRFQSQHINRDEHLKYLFAYIHLNPIKRIEPQWKELGIKNLLMSKKFLSNYTYSSYADYIGPSYVIPRVEELILTKKDFPEYFESEYYFDKFVENWLTFKENPIT